jgi:hypothetical protein
MLVQPTVQPIPSAGFSVAVGAVVPPTVQLYEVPTGVVEVVPGFRGYRYFRVGEQIAVVEPGTNRIVQVF